MVMVIRSSPHSVSVPASERDDNTPGQNRRGHH